MTTLDWQINMLCLHLFLYLIAVSELWTDLKECSSGRLRVAVSGQVAIVMPKTVPPIVDQRI